MKKCRIKMTGELLRTMLKVKEEARIANVTFYPNSDTIVVLFFDIGPECAEGATAPYIENVEEIQEEPIKPEGTECLRG